MTGSCNYLYGVTRGEGAMVAGMAGLDGGEVRLIRHGPAAMVVSRSAVISFAQLAPEKTLRYLAEHQRVLERVMEDSAVIPIKFGTYAADDGQVLSILESGRDQFIRALNRHASTVEMDLVAWWTDLAPVLGELAGDPEVQAVKGRIGPAATTEDRVRLGQLVKGLLDRRRSLIAADLTGALSAEWAPLVCHSIKDDSMILNVAALVDRGQEERFDQTVQRLNSRYAERLSFRRVGPLPPYSFATVEVTMLGEAELDAARQTLELGEFASLEEAKAASRRLLHEHHPDRNRADDSSARVEQITAAFAVLERFARNFRHRLAGPGGAGMPIVRVCNLSELRTRPAGHAA